MLRTPALAADVVRLTGLTVERRAEGLALIDTAGLAERRFPASGSVAHAALLLLGEIADRVIDPDAPVLRRLPVSSPAERRAVHVAEVDRGLPASAVLTELVEPPPRRPSLCRASRVIPSRRPCTRSWRTPGSPARCLRWFKSKPHPLICEARISTSRTKVGSRPLFPTYSL